MLLLLFWIKIIILLEFIISMQFETWKYVLILFELFHLQIY
jgi:hypothetical protein